MKNWNKLLDRSIIVNRTVHLDGITDIESELYDAILTSPPGISFDDLKDKYCDNKYTNEQIIKAFQSLERKKYLNYDDRFNTIDLYLKAYL